jgi:hypothetical protein
MPESALISNVEKKHDFLLISTADKNKYNFKDGSFIIWRKKYTGRVFVENWDIGSTLYP